MQVSIQNALTLNRETLIQKMLCEAAPRMAGDFAASRKLLARFRKAEPFTAAQTGEIQDMETVRNIIFHNNSVVDAPMAGCSEWEVGRRVHFALAFPLVALAVFNAVQHIGGALLEQYPWFGAGQEQGQFEDLLTSLDAGLAAPNVSDDEVQAMQTMEARFSGLDDPPVYDCSPQFRAGQSMEF